MITIDWLNRIINIPKSYTQLVQSMPTEIRNLSIDQFRLDLRALEATFDGMAYPITHRHVQPVNVGGVTLARVVEIINNYTITFEDGQYAVNLVGANSNIADVTNVNQVSVRSANSAGLTFSEEINNQSFLGGMVYIDINGLGLPGTNFPRGTPTDPVDNYLDARTIADNRKLYSFSLSGTLFLPISNDISNTIWRGYSPIRSILVFSNENIEGTVIERMGITGSANGRASYSECAIGGPLGFTGLQGLLNECGINNNITLDANATENIVFRECISIIAGVNRVNLDCNNTIAPIHFRGWVGGLNISNYTGGQNMSIDVHSGVVELENTCNSGTIVIRGICDVIDNSAAGCTVINEASVISGIEQIISLETADEEKNVSNNKYFKRDKDTGEVLVEKDYNIDGSGNETLINP